MTRNQKDKSQCRTKQRRSLLCAGWSVVASHSARLGNKQRVQRDAPRTATRLARLGNDAGEKERV